MAVERRKYRDRRKYLIAAVHKRRRKVRAMAVAYKGGRCERCGYDRCADALDFHHRNPGEKDFSVSEKGYTRSWVRVKRELDKCVLLCSNCHRELHAQLAASAGNSRVTSGLIQGTRTASGGGNPELSAAITAESAETLHPLP